MKLSDLPEIDFVDVDADTVEDAVFTSYANITGRELHKADPIRLFLLFVSDVFVRLRNKINDTAKQNLLKYSREDNLENLAALLGVTRLPASAAVTTMKVTLSAARDIDVTIPAGTRVATDDYVNFATSKALVISAGETEGTVSASCVKTGTTGNGYAAGEIHLVVDPVPFVKSIVNTTKSEGGSDIETDDTLRERVFEAPESFSTAGPAGAYAFWAKSTNSAIVDVSVTSPSPGVVQVVPLLTGGGIPGEEVLKEVDEKLSANDIRPLTDNVKVIAPTLVNYDVDAKYYIDMDADAATVQANVSAAVAEYVLWQKSKLGRDIVPSRLIQKIMAVSGVKRIDVTTPVYTSVEGTQVAHEGTVSVTMAGSEDE